MIEEFIEEIRFLLFRYGYKKTQPIIIAISEFIENCDLEIALRLQSKTQILCTIINRFDTSVKPVLLNAGASEVIDSFERTILIHIRRLFADRSDIGMGFGIILKKNDKLRRTNKQVLIKSGELQETLTFYLDQIEKGQFAAKPTVHSEPRFKTFTVNGARLRSTQPGMVLTIQEEYLPETMLGKFIFKTWEEGSETTGEVKDQPYMGPLEDGISSPLNNQQLEKEKLNKFCVACDEEVTATYLCKACENFIHGINKMNF